MDWQGVLKRSWIPVTDLVSLLWPERLKEDAAREKIGTLTCTGYRDLENWEDCPYSDACPYCKSSASEEYAHAVCRALYPDLRDEVLRRGANDSLEALRRYLDVSPPQFHQEWMTLDPAKCAPARPGSPPTPKWPVRQLITSVTGGGAYLSALLRLQSAHVEVEPRPALHQLDAAGLLPESVRRLLATSEADTPEHDIHQDIAAWEAILPRLRGAKLNAAKLVIEKFRGKSHEKAYEAALPDGEAADNDGKKTYVRKAFEVAQQLAQEHNLRLPPWNSQFWPTSGPKIKS